MPQQAARVRCSSTTGCPRPMPLLAVVVAIPLLYPPTCGLWHLQQRRDGLVRVMLVAHHIGAVED